MKNILKNKRYHFLLSLGALTALSGLNLAHAQREAPDRAAAATQRQQQMANMTPEQRVQFFQQRWQERYNAATPEQKAQMDDMRAQFEARLKEQGLDPTNPADLAKAMQNGTLTGMMGNRGNQNGAQNPANRDAGRRQLMIQAGITDKTTQDTIIAFMDSEDKARQPLLQLARAAAKSLNPGTDETVTNSLNAYETALAADKTRRDAALADLDAKISYSTTPRLKSFLTLVGVLEPDSLALGGASVIFASNTGGNNDANRQNRRGNRNRNNANGNNANGNNANAGNADQNGAAAPAADNAPAANAPAAGDDQAPVIYLLAKRRQ